VSNELSRRLVASFFARARELRRYHSKFITRQRRRFGDLAENVAEVFGAATFGARLHVVGLEQGLVHPPSHHYPVRMSYTTLEVEIEHGRIVSKEPQKLPEKGSGLLTILTPHAPAGPRPIGLARGEFTVPDDFNAPLPEDVLRGFEGK